MSRTPKQKILENSKLLKKYASWIYCTHCNKTVAYLCYVTYDLFNLNYTCNCGSCGKVYIEFEHTPLEKNNSPLKLSKNRMCCPKDDSPLVTIVDKNIQNYEFNITCNSCNLTYTSKNTFEK